MFSDELLKYYSWKGQKQKKSLSEFIICKVIIGIIFFSLILQLLCQYYIVLFKYSI